MMELHAYVDNSQMHAAEIEELVSVDAAKRMANWINVTDLKEIVALFEKYRDDFADYAGKTPSARERRRFTDDNHRDLVLLGTLAHAYMAVDVLQVANERGLLRAGGPYRAMTERAALLWYSMHGKYTPRFWTDRLQDMAPIRKTRLRRGSEFEFDTLGSSALGDSLLSNFGR